MGVAAEVGVGKPVLGRDTGRERRSCGAECGTWSVWDAPGTLAATKTVHRTLIRLVMMTHL